MRGLLADVNVQGHLAYLEYLILAEWGEFVAEAGLDFVTFRDLKLDRHMDDRELWTFCQSEGWVLFTEDRNDDGPNSLTSTLSDSWAGGMLPILTLANKGRFEHDGGYAAHVAAEVAEILYGIKLDSKYRDQPRIYIPR